MKSKFVCSLVSLSLFLSFTGISVFAEDFENFSDVTATTATPYEITAIQELKTYGIVGGYSDGTFKPNANINRAEFLKIILEAMAMPIDLEGGNCFKDVKDGWFAPYVCWAADSGIVGGYKDGTFKPEQNITFAEASKILATAFKLPVDEKYTENWFEKYVVALENEKAIPDSVTSFDHQMTRAEMAYSVFLLSRDMEFPYKKDQLTYADVHTMEEAGDFNLMKYFLRNFYTDGSKVYRVSFAKMLELPEADPSRFRPFYDTKTNLLYSDDENLYYLHGDSDRLIFLEDMDKDSMEILATEVDVPSTSDLLSQNDKHEWGSKWILFKDKNALYTPATNFYSPEFSGLKNVTGQVENLKEFKYYPCETICGMDDSGFYYLDSYFGDSFVKLDGFDYDTFSQIEDENGVVIPYLIKDEDHVYEFTSDGVKIVGGADAKNLKIIYYGNYGFDDNRSQFFVYPKTSGSKNKVEVDNNFAYLTQFTFLYFTDGKNVWFRDINGYKNADSEMIGGADPKNFDYFKDLDERLIDFMAG